jgi:putative hydrolase of the HAD superfamily
MKSVKAVLFDLDETLFDHSWSVAHSMELLRAEHECLQTRTLEDILSEHRRLLEEMHIDVMAGRLHPDQSRIRRMYGIFKFCGVDVSEEIALRAAALHRQRYRDAQRAVPGAAELLTSLRERVKIGIVTNNFLEEQRAKLEVCGLTSLIDELVTSEECGITKPAPEIFHIALHRLRCSAEEAVMVGDSWEVDVVGARNAGIRPIWFNRFGFSQPAGERVHEIHSLDEFTLQEAFLPDLQSRL